MSARTADHTEAGDGASPGQAIGGGPDLFQAAKPLVLQRVKETRLQERALQAIEVALARGAPPDQWAGPGTPLSGAVSSRSLDFVEILLQARANPNDTDEKGVSALHLAAFDGNDLACRALLGARADVNAADPHAQTALFFAPTRAVCETLFRAHADVNAMNSNGQSALHLAAKAGLGDTLQWLSVRQSRATVCLRDYQGKTAEEYAIAAGCRREALEAVRQAAGGAPVQAKAQVPTRTAIAPGEDSLPHPPAQLTSPKRDFGASNLHPYQAELIAPGMSGPPPTPSPLLGTGGGGGSPLGAVPGGHALRRSQKKLEEEEMLRRNSVLQAKAVARKSLLSHKG